MSRQREVRLQAGIVRRHSELYPLQRGQLYHIPNERNNKIQVFQAQSLGIVPGVADMLYFSKAFNVATELKVPESRHKISSIKRQIKWGEIWEREGNVWRLCRTVDEAISCYEGNFKGLTIKQVKKMIKNVKTQTIKF